MTRTRLLELCPRTPLDRRWVWGLLAILLLGSLGLRLWYATPDPTSTRYWDERYGLENLEPLLKEGSFRPVHGFHPTLSYLPHGVLLKVSDLLYRATGRELFRIFDRRGGYTPTAYLICRSLHAVIATLGLLIVFLIGRKLGGSRLGLLAAFFLSVVPWHLRQSILFKSDMVLLFTVVFTVYMSLRAVERPSNRSFAAAGLAIGLALSSKFNAGPVAVPLTVGAFLGSAHKRRAVWLLTLAAICSVGVFLLLQPFVLIEPGIYTRSMRTTTWAYEQMAQRQGDHSRLYLIRHAIESLMSGSFHGPLVGGLGLIGLMILAVLSLKSWGRSAVSLSWLMIVSYVIGYTIMYTVATPLPSEHNWLPLTPFVSLAAAWTLLALWILLRQSRREPSWRYVGAIGVGLVVMLLSWSAFDYVYRQTVPSTGDRVLELLNGRLRRPAGRIVIAEHDFAIPFNDRHRKGRLALRQVENLIAVPRDRLHGADAEVFPAARLEDSALASRYRKRMQRVRDRQVHVFEPRLFRSWGPSLIVLLHPHRMKGNPRAGELVRSLDDPSLYQGRLLPVEGAQHWLWIEFSLPRRIRVGKLEIGQGSYQPIEFRGPRLRRHYVSPRFPYSEEVRLRLGTVSGPERIPFVDRQWRVRGIVLPRE